MQLVERRGYWHEVGAMIDSLPTLPFSGHSIIGPRAHGVDAWPHSHGIAEHDVDELVETLGFDSAGSVRFPDPTLLRFKAKG